MVNALTDKEKEALAAFYRDGSSAAPIRKYGNQWIIDGPFQRGEIGGFPIRRQAKDAYLRWIDELIRKEQGEAAMEAVDALCSRAGWNFEDAMKAFEIKAPGMDPEVRAAYIRGAIERRRRMQK